MTRVLPIMRDRLLPHFPGPEGFTVASVVARIALSHALIPDDDPELFLPSFATPPASNAQPKSPRRGRRRPGGAVQGEGPMSPRWHRVLTQAFLFVNSLFWLPWGLINLIRPESWSGEVIPDLDVYDLSSAVARTEVRAMYGGLQMAIGIFALLGAFRPKYRDAALVFFVLALTGLARAALAG